MGKGDYCRTRGGGRDRSIHMAVMSNGLLSPRCSPSLGRTKGGFVGCRGPATCVVCKSIERKDR